jgi:hypothetical protein
MLLFTQHYSDPENYGGVPPDFKRFYITPEGVAPNMQVKLDYQFTNTEGIDVPAVYIGFSDFLFEKKVLNDYAGSREDMSAESSMSIVTTNLVVRHISETPDESLMLGTISTAFLHGIRSSLMKALRLKGYEVKQLTRLTMPSGDKAFKQFECAAVVVLNYQNTWETFTESQRIKKFNIGVTPSQC